jgi:hypothetical protein
MSKQQEMDARLQNALTVIQSVTPPSLPADAEVMTIVIESAREVQRGDLAVTELRPSNSSNSLFTCVWLRSHRPSD